jgi:3-deoxy-D-manno-octulosonate 8-phosphate phosphatase (KDO 8-P phosphatase)
MPSRSPSVLQRARRVRALVFDVDGVLTDGHLWYDRRGEELKVFSARDGFSIRLAQREGLLVAILTGRVTPALRARVADLGIPSELVVEGSTDKRRDLKLLARRMNLPLAQVAYVGDDLPDLPALTVAGLAGCPADATAEVRSSCHMVCRSRGGDGVAREVVQTVLRAQGRWNAIVASWRAGTAAAGYCARGKGAKHDNS